MNVNPIRFSNTQHQNIYIYISYYYGELFNTHNNNPYGRFHQDYNPGILPGGNCFASILARFSTINPLLD